VLHTPGEQVARDGSPRGLRPTSTPSDGVCGGARIAWGKRDFAELWSGVKAHIGKDCRVHPSLPDLLASSTHITNNTY
jgi:hypothetical protein